MRIVAPSDGGLKFAAPRFGFLEDDDATITAIETRHPVCVESADIRQARSAHRPLDDGEISGLSEVHHARVASRILQSHVVNNEIEVGAAIVTQSVLDAVFVAPCVRDFAAVGNGCCWGTVEMTGPDGVVYLFSVSNGGKHEYIRSTGNYDSK